MMICILSMDRPAVGLRFPKLLILIAAFWTVMSGRQLQTFIPAMSKERTIPIWFGLFSFIPLLFLLTLVFLLFHPTLIIIFLLSLPFIQQNSRCNTRLCRPIFWRSPCSYQLFCLSRRLFISLYSSANICIWGSTVPVSLDLVDVRTLVFPLSSLASTMFWSPRKGLSSTFIF